MPDNSLLEEIVLKNIDYLHHLDALDYSYGSKLRVTDVRAVVLSGLEINCEQETAHALKLAGANVDIIHFNELKEGKRIPSGEPVNLTDYHILAGPGGFAGGDYMGAGVLLATLTKAYLWDQLMEFRESGKLIIGICNYMQVFVKTGMAPAFEGNYGERQATMSFNESGSFYDRWVLLKKTSDLSPFTRGIDYIPLPIRHGEGNFTASEEDIERLERQGQKVFVYANSDGEPANGEFPYNPNGSTADIAGICDETGRVLLMMPHPEGYWSFLQHPHWTRIKEKLSREGKNISKYGLGMEIFYNAIKFAEKNLVK